MKRYIKSNRDDEYFGQIAYDKYGDMILSKLNGKKISKRRDKAEEPGGLIYESKQLGIDLWDLLEALEGMCHNGTAREIDDSTYRVGKIGVKSSTNITSSKTVVIDPVTIPNIRKAMRNISRDDYGTTLLIPGWGQIKKVGKRYAVGPLPENDDSDVLTDYSAWSYDVSEGQVLDWIKSEMNSVNSATNTCNIASKPVFGDDDFEEDDFSETYTVYGYYGRNFTGLSDSEDFDNLSQAEDYVWELLQNGAYVELYGPDSTRRFSPDKLDESREANGEVYDITDAEI